MPLRGRAIPDYRAGFNWFQPWGLDLIQATREKTRRAAWFAEAYSDVSYYRRYNDNVIGYLQLKGGLSFPLKGVAPLQVFAAVNFIKDANDDFYNNVGEFGPGLRFAPIRRFPQFQIQAQYIRGYYTTNAQHSHNPYGRVYHDCRFFIIWSKYF